MMRHRPHCQAPEGDLLLYLQVGACAVVVPTRIQLGRRTRAALTPQHTLSSSAPPALLFSCPPPVLLPSCPHVLSSPCPPVLLLSSCPPPLLLSSCPSPLLLSSSPPPLLSSSPPPLLSSSLPLFLSSSLPPPPLTPQVPAAVGRDRQGDAGSAWPDLGRNRRVSEEGVPP